EVPMPEPSLDVSVDAALELDSSADAQAGQTAFTIHSETDLAGIDPALAGEVSYEITGGNEQGYFELGVDADGNPVLKLTEAGAEAIRNGQFDPAGANVTVTGTQVIAEGLLNPFDLSAQDGAGLEVPMPEPSLDVSVDAALELDSSADAQAGQTAFTIHSETDLAGIDPALAGEVSYEITGGNEQGYFELGVDADGNPVLKLTEAGAEAIRNGQFDPAGANVTVTGTQVIAEGLLNPFNLTDSDSAVVDVPVDPPQIFGLDGDGADITVYEKHLEQGSSPDEEALPGQGEFGIQATSGIKELHIAGQVITIDDLLGLSSGNPIVIETEGGNTLLITGYDGNANSGTVYYEFVLADAVAHPDQGPDTIPKDGAISVKLVDTLGQESAGEAINVDIVDDIPEFGTPEDVSLGLDSGSSAIGDLDLTIGADVDGAKIADANLLTDVDGHVRIRYEDDDGAKETYLTSGGTKLVYVFDSESQQLIVYKVGDNPSNPVLTIDMSVSDNQYEVVVHQPLDPVAVSFTTDVIGNQGGGIDGELVISNPNLSAQFTGVGGAVNWSTNGIGVGNNLIGAGQTLIAQFNQTLTELSFEMGNSGALSWEIFSNGVSVGTGNGTTASASGGFDEIRFYGSSGGNQYNVKNFQGVFLDAELGYTLPVDVVAVDGDGDTTDGSFNIDFQPGEVPPLPQLPTILGLTDSDITVNEKYLDGGTAEGEGQAADSGSFKLSTPEGFGALLIAGTKVLGDGEQQGNKVKLSAGDLESLAAGNVIVIETPEGNTLTLTGYDSATGEVSYSFELGSAVEHESGEGRNELAKEGIQLELVDGLGHIAYGTVDVVVVDDIPFEFDLVQAIQVPVSEIEVGQLGAGWENLTTTSGSGSVTTASDENGIFIQWGGTNGSGYDFIYAEGLSGSEGVGTDSLFSLGTLTHNNFVISGGSKVLKTVDLEVSFKVMIDGVLTEVTTVIQLEHDETPNTHPDPTHPDNDDIVKILNPDQEQVIQVGDREYVLKIRGFLDTNGNLVDTVYTTETEASSFELFAEIASTDDLPQINGNVEADWGADGPAEENSLLWSDGEGGTLANGVVQGQFGTLTVNADGSYTYVVSRSARDGMKAGESYQDEFTYYLTDADGDVVASKLTINLEGVPNGIVASDNVAIADVSLIEIDATQTSSSHSVGNGFLDTGSKTREWKEEFDIAVDGGGVFSFNANVSAPRGSASLAWKLEKFGDAGWEVVSGIGGRVGSGNFNTPELDSGSYRITFQAEVSGGSFVWGYPSVSVTTTFNHDAYGVWEASGTQGNVLSDPGIDGSTDIPGSSGTLLKALVGSDYVEATQSGLVIAGQYGTFTLFANGDYRYEPAADVANVGKIDSLTYQLVHPSGATAEASLQVGITGPGVDSFVWGTDGDDALTGGAGNDIIIGGAGDDTLVGGLGADTFVWNLGDQGEAGAPATDKVMDFTLGQFGVDGEADKLDIADLLDGASSSNLAEYLHASDDGSGNTVLQISHNGGFTGGVYDESVVDQTIVLKGVAYSDALIQQMLSNGQLEIE
ncbi:type I secretion C-terminal target domain-containing protein, partial [Halomonas desiderata]|nr:type I secretion C-terminal target domain-containing protein [Halomonas desiderata]